MAAPTPHRETDDRLQLFKKRIHGPMMNFEEELRLGVEVVIYHSLGGRKTPGNVINAGGGVHRWLGSPFANGAKPRLNRRHYCYANAEPNGLIHIKYIWVLVYCLTLPVC